MSVEQDFDPNKSPFLKNKNLYDAAFSQIKTMLSNLKNNIKMFPIVGPACICLFDRKTDEKTIKGSLKCLQKGSQVLNISNINNKECEKSKFVSKKAFRELFSEEVE